MKKFEMMPTKADVQKHLKDGFAYMTATLNALDPADIAGPKHSSVAATPLSRRPSAWPATCTSTSVNSSPTPA